ncbi:hypothetical protein [Streptomyces arenae]|uniref:hypothetical protein n=1 Tax=Streptomyces arenae TaxID=29301 RepID=UPI00265ADA7D|nr:hypothetical protein [Streptomyces arenae]MCG7203948.1 hypothetical protein [Streptomyces arenae]
MPDIVPPGTKITGNLLTYRSPYVVAHGALTSNSGSISSTTEVNIVATSSAVLTAGRAYRIEYHGLIQHGTASLLDLCYLRLRRGAGGLIRNWQSVLVANRGTASRNMPISLATIVTPASTITDTVVLTASWDTGSSATFVLSATAGTPGLLTVYDVGPASDFPGIATF